MNQTHSIGLTFLLSAALMGVALAAPPPPLVDMRFEEKTGATTQSTGTLSGTATFVQEDGFPAFSTQVPKGPFAPSNNASAVDFGGIEDAQGGRAIDLVSSGDGTVGALNAFTLCGWVNCRDLRVGFGGNRIAFALESPNGPGFDLVQLANGALRIGINQWPDGGGGGGPSSSTGKITEDAQTGAANWVFFAVSYDSAAASGNVKFYFGTPTQLADLDVERNYQGGAGNGGAIESSGPLTLGNFGEVVGARTETGPNGGSRVLRGLLDEMRVYNAALPLEDVQRVQLNGEPPPTPVSITTPPASQTVFAGERATLSVQASGTSPISYQWQKDGQNILGATERTYSIPATSLADDKQAFRVVLSNALNSATSEPATLTVLPENNHKISLSFSEGTGTTTANQGNLGGQGTLVRKDDFPVFSTQVPNGPQAPTGNVGSIDFGAIEDGQGGRAIDFTNTFGNTLRPMKAFTVTGWINCRDLTEGFGGNRITFALASPNGPGFDLVQLNTGALRIGVNQWPDGGNGGGPRSTDGMITEDPATGAANWVFFAVTYDAAAATGNIKYYFGSPSKAVAFDVEADYAQGEILSSGRLTVGNFSPVVGARTENGPGGGSRVVRGLMDEINVFNKALTLAEIAALQKAPLGTTAAPPQLSIRREGNEAVLFWPSSSFKLQSSNTMISGSWAEAPEAPVVAGQETSARISLTSPQRFFRLSSP